jgi:hypothetical protein
MQRWFEFTIEPQSTASTAGTPRSLHVVITRDNPGLVSAWGSLNVSHAKGTDNVETSPISSRRGVQYSGGRADGTRRMPRVTVLYTWSLNSGISTFGIPVAVD